MLLGNSCAGGEGLVQAVLEAGGVEGLLRVARLRGQRLTLTGCCALARVAVYGSRQQVHALVGMGGLQALCRGLAQGGSGQQKDLAELVQGLGAMLLKGVQAELLVEAGAGVVLQRLEREGRGEVQEIARDVGQRLRDRGSISVSNSV